MPNNYFSYRDISPLHFADRELHGLYDRQQYATGASQNDAILISSDDESDYDDLDWQSDTSFPAPHELGNPAKYSSASSGTVDGEGTYLSDL